VLQLLEPLPNEIPGGEIITDPGMGVLCDAALILVEKISPPRTEEDRAATLRLALKDLNSQGLVGVHDASVFPENLALYKKYRHPAVLQKRILLILRFADAGELTLRIYAMADCPPMNGFCYDQIERLENYGNGFLTVRSVKLFMDGALGSWGAAMIEEYSDKPGSRGSMVLNYTELEHLIQQVPSPSSSSNLTSSGIR